MEGAFGFDFGPVRVHRDQHAEALGALAYTSGSDLHFAPGQYDPSNTRGQKLIGHELAHVVQHSEGRVAATKQLRGVALGESPALEREANTWGERAARGEAVARSGTTTSPRIGGGPVQRFKDYNSGEEADEASPATRQWAYSRELRVTDDGNAAVAQDDGAPGSQTLFIRPYFLDSINGALKAARSPLELEIVSGGDTVTGRPPSRNFLQYERTLVQVSEPRDIPDDCREAARMVTGASLAREKLKAECVDSSGARTISRYIEPDMMKYEIMVNHFGRSIKGANTILAELEPTLDDEKLLAKTRKLKITSEAAEQAVVTAQKQVARYTARLTDAGSALEVGRADMKLQEAKRDLETKVRELANAMKAYTDFVEDNAVDIKGLDQRLAKLRRINTRLINRIMKPYKDLGDPRQDSFDAKAGLNRYADPKVGEAYTISSSREREKGQDTWNFHWGGVLLKTGPDNVVKENYRGNKDSDWTFQIYGVPTSDDARIGQTFHEQHRYLNQHGISPTTLKAVKTP